MATGFGRAFAIVGEQGMAMRSAISLNIVDGLPNYKAIDLILVIQPALRIWKGIFFLRD